MKKQLIAAAALALVSGAAAAQSNVTLYGIIDTGVYTTNASGAGNQSQTTMVSGTWLPSLFGIKGSEDLGGGLKTNFDLQSNLGSVDGTQSPTSSVMFGRNATVGLSGGFGKVDAGRQIDILFLQSFLNGVIPTHTNSLAVNGLLAYYPGTLATSAGDTVGAFVNNVIAYTTPDFNGLKATVQYAIGGTTNGASANQNMAGLLTYNNSGLSLSAGYESQNGSTGTTVLQKGLVGAKYSLGAIDFAAQYNSFKNPNPGAIISGSTASGAVDANGIEAGVAYHFSPVFLAGVNFERFNNNIANTTPTIISLKAKYELSKRTSIWGLVSNYNADAAYAMPQGYALGTTGATNSATGFGVGITHTF